MKKLLFVLVILLTFTFVIADDTIGRHIYSTVTTTVTTGGTAVAVFNTTGNCVSILVQALGANAANVNAVVDRDASNVSTSDQYIFTLSARETIRLKEVTREQLLLYVTSGTEGVTAICETSQ